MPTSITYLSGNNLETITFDTAHVRGGFESEITTHPIEKGADASDNVHEKPEGVTIDALITDYPMSIHGGGIGVPHEAGRTSDTIELLIYLKSKGVRFGIDTALRQYSSMALQTITPNADRLKGAARVTLVFTKLVIVATETVNVNVAANRSGQKKTEKGKQQPKESKEPLKSNLAKIVDSDFYKKGITLDLIK